MATRPKSSLADPLSGPDRTALRDSPFAAELYNNRGAMLLEQGHAEEAVESFRTALSIRPDLATGYENLGEALTWLGDLEQAVESYGQALELSPDSPRALCGLGSALRMGGLVDDAVSVLSGALVLDPGRGELYFQLALAYRERGEWGDAIECLESALRIDPEWHEARWVLAGACLSTGDFDRGFAHFRRVTDLVEGLKRDFEQPAWDGAPLEGKTILLHLERSYRDAILFVRYAPMVKAMGGRVLVEAPRPMRQLFESCRGVDGLVAQGDALPHFDVHAPLTHLPALLHTKLAAIPARVPYLMGGFDRREVAAEARSKLRVGIVWEASDTDFGDPDRTASLRDFEPLFDLPGLEICSLQTGTAVEDLRGHPAARWIEDLGSGLDDLGEMARVVADVDVVISVDTTVAHVAGALGRPVWVMLPFLPEWYWFQERSDSPWYPTARLFRQTEPGDWAQVMRQLAAALADEVAAS